MLQQQNQTYVEWGEQLMSKQFRVKGIATNVIHSKRSKLRTTLFVHGISGDYHGLVPLGYEMRTSTNCVFVDLPGHGRTAIPKWHSIAAHRSWFKQLLQTLADEGFEIDHIVAHSFGCIVLDEDINIKEATLLNPVPRARTAFKKYAKTMYVLRWPLSLFYNLYPLALSRGLALNKNRSKESIARIHWLTRQTVTCGPQFRYHTLVSLKTLPISALTSFRRPLAARTTVVIGLDDTMSEELDTFELEKIFGESKILFLKGGHLLPIESPSYVADTIGR